MRTLVVLLLAFSARAQDEDARARRIAAEMIGVDSHIDAMQRVVNEGLDLADRLADGQVDFDRLRKGGVGAPFFALYVPTFYGEGSEAVRRTLQLRDAAQQLFDRHPDQMELALTAADIERIRGKKKLAVVLTLEGGYQIAEDLSVLRVYQRLGIRSMTLTHVRSTGWADSGTDRARNNGLSEFGKQVVREMNRIGMIVDVSHVSDKTFMDAIAVSSKPVIASHSSCRALTDVPRNVTDDMLRALARNGGVIGISFVPGFINKKDAASQTAKIQEMHEDTHLTGRALDEYAARSHRNEDPAHPKPAFATIDDVVAHIDHAVKIAGIDHVGIGSDFDGITTVPKGLEDISKMPSLIAALLKRGYSEADVRKIFGGNLLRVFRQVVGQ